MNCLARQLVGQRESQTERKGQTAPSRAKGAQLPPLFALVGTRHRRLTSELASVRGSLVSGRDAAKSRRRHRLDCVPLD